MHKETKKNTWQQGERKDRSDKSMQHPIVIIFALSLETQNGYNQQQY